MVEKEVERSRGPGAQRQVGWPRRKSGEHL